MVTLPRGPLGIGGIGEGNEHDSHSVMPHENGLFSPNSKVRTETQFIKRIVKGMLFLLHSDFCFSLLDIVNVKIVYIF